MRLLDYGEGEKSKMSRKFGEAKDPESTSTSPQNLISVELYSNFENE